MELSRNVRITGQSEKEEEYGLAIYFNRRYPKNRLFSALSGNICFLYTRDVYCNSRSTCSTRYGWTQGFSAGHDDILHQPCPFDCRKILLQEQRLYKRHQIRKNGYYRLVCNTDISLWHFYRVLNDIGRIGVGPQEHLDIKNNILKEQNSQMARTRNREMSKVTSDQKQVER